MNRLEATAVSRPSLPSQAVSKRTFNGTLGGPILERLLQVNKLSGSERLGRLCTDTQNCSQKDLQWRILVSKVGTSSLGSFTPFLSEDVVGESAR